tara:strand:- start:183 stop:416 length:234 start_codon:yes stop_codon:yes gene_type:complete
MRRGGRRGRRAVGLGHLAQQKQRQYRNEEFAEQPQQREHAGLSSTRILNQPPGPEIRKPTPRREIRQGHDAGVARQG